MVSEPQKFRQEDYREFSFCDYLFDIRTGLAQFHYQLRSENGVIDFEERIQFAHDGEVAFDQGRLDPLLALLGAVLGVSYYKVSVAPLVNLE
ncbi:MAG: hypothetical protein WBA28_02895, partial [Microbacteriaceae bacterium]